MFPEKEEKHMRVLILAPYVFDKRFSEFTKNRTGFGIMVNDIFHAISQESEAYLLSYVLTKGHGNILPHTLWSILRNINFKDVMQAIKWALRYKQSLTGRIRYAFYCINKGMVRKTIKKLQPDIVHIHSVNFQTKTFIEVCEELETPYIVTLHGLIGFDEELNAPLWEKEYKAELLLHCAKQNIPVTVISTGIKKRIENSYTKKECSNIVVVSNATTLKVDTQVVINRNLREEFSIPPNAKIAISVGSIYPNKNQMQIVEAVSLLPYDQRKNLYVFFCGVDWTNGAIQQRIDALGLQSNVIILGFVPHQELCEIYTQADLNILASINEGFGLSIVESFVNGLPTVTFSDLDAIPDLYDVNAMLLCEDRSTETLADRISKAIHTDWDKNAIKEHGKKFSIDAMAKKYIQVYHSSI